MRLAGHHAVVTGGGTGIGAAVARALAAEGAKLTLVARREQPLRETAATIEGAAFVAADVSDRAQVGAAFAQARDTHGPITILVNNAGIGHSSPFAKVTEESWRQVMAVNLDALLHCSQAALPDLIAAPAGRLITVASVAGLKGGSYIAPYVAAKHGAVGFTRALAVEFAKTNLTVNAVCPGFTDTDMVAEAIANIQEKTGRSKEEAGAELAKFSPQGRLITPDEVASAVVWLCLPENRSVNGQALVVAGGDA